MLKTLFEIKNIKLAKARFFGNVGCLIIALLACMILTFYHSTSIIFQFDLGFTILRLSILFFVGVSICASAFDRICRER